RGPQAARSQEVRVARRVQHLGCSTSGAAPRVQQVHGRAGRVRSRGCLAKTVARRVLWVQSMIRSSHRHALSAAAAAATATLAVTGCGGKDCSLSATAKVEGSFVVITATCNMWAQVEAAGVPGECRPDAPTVLRVPAQRLGAGAKSVAVSGTGA